MGRNYNIQKSALSPFNIKENFWVDKGKISKELNCYINNVGNYLAYSPKFISNAATKVKVGAGDGGMKLWILYMMNTNLIEKLPRVTKYWESNQIYLITCSLIFNFLENF